MTKKRRTRIILALAGVLAGVAAAALVRDCLPGTGSWARPPRPVPTPPVAVTPVDAPAVRARAWERTERLLAEAEQAAAAALERHLATIDAFLAERKPGSRAFAAALLGLRGKWELVKAQLGGDTEGQYAAFLAEAFAAHVFRATDLEQAVAAAVRGYLAELDGIEDALLVRLRADLADDALPVAAVVPALRSEQAFRQRYRDLAGRVAQDLRTDLAVVAGRELFLWEATTLATDLTLKAGAAVAARLGASTTILSAGAAASWRTLGVGLVVAIVLDAVVNRIIKAAGYDAEEQVAGRVAQTLDDLGRSITDGDPEARAALEKLQAMQRDDPDAEVRAAALKAVRSIEAGTQPFGLRGELTKIAAARASWRQETLRRLIQESEVNP